MDENPTGGFAYLPATGRTFSQGVIALDGYVFRRIQLRESLPMESGLNLAAQVIQTAGRPLTALCGCELRIPRPLTRVDFSAFNRRYIAALASTGFHTDPVNPAARTNMAPTVDAPKDATLVAFTFAVPGPSGPTGADFLVSGKPELANDPSRVIAPGDLSPAGLRKKAAFVLQELQRIVQQLGGFFNDTATTEIYTREPIDDLRTIFESASLSLSLCTHIPGDPPVVGPGDFPLVFEGDVRSITVEETA